MASRFNLVVFIGLLLSAISINFGIFLGEMYPGTKIFELMVGFGPIFGWFFGMLATISFIIGSIMFFIGKIDNFWKSLYPTNIGLTVLGLSSFVYNPAHHPSSWIFGAIVLTVVVSYILHKLHIAKYKVLIPILVGMVFIGDFWFGFIVAMIFVILSFLSGASKTISETFNSWRKSWGKPPAYMEE